MIPRLAPRFAPVAALRQAAATVGLLAVLAGAGWGAGLAWFIGQAGKQAAPPPIADGIVALTGGADRVATALRLLALGHGRVLLISGVGGAAELAELARRAGIDPVPLGARVTLGRAATSTLGNATETASWAAGNGLRSLIVVTAGYHMPRALTELGRAMPGVTLYPVPVVPPALRGAPDGPTLRLLAGEYTKWLAASVGLDRLAAGSGA